MGRKEELAAWLDSRPWAQVDSVQVATDDLNAMLARFSAAIGDFRTAFETVGGYVDSLEQRLVVLESERRA